MDSEGVTKLIEMVNLPLASDSKEKTLLEANGIISNQETVDKSQSTKASEKENQNIIENEIELTLKNGESNVKNVANNDDATKNENKEEYSHAEMTTKTTTIVTEKSNEESASTHTETKTANTVSVKANETATIAAVTKSDNDDVIPLKDNSIMEVEVEVEKAKPKLNESDKVIPDEPATDATERNAEKSQEIESGESTSDEDEDQEAEAETEIKTEKIDGVQGETKISDQPESPERLKTDEDVLNVKTNNANKEINNQIISIISDIDINIKAQEKITQLKEQELELIQKQKELANQIHQQQLLAQKLIAQNQLKEQEFQAQQSLLQQQQQKFEIQNEYEKEATVPKVSQQLLAQKLIAQNKLKDQEFQAQRSLQQQQKFQIQNEYDKETVLPKVSQEYTKLNNRQKDCYELKESSNVSRTVDLRKIFTPATDAPQILPKNRKLYASSAFYSSTLHPTVEDQVELARRISHSLSDISNQKSKGQSMYVNRKKRSVKWVHEASGQEEDDIIETESLNKENAETNSKTDQIKPEKMPLKLVMNPRGQIRDYNSQKESINVESGLLSPDNCAELITALQLHKGRGAELFAKRRRKAENWVVDETNAGIYSPSGIPDYQQYQARPVSSPNILPAYSDAGKHRVQLNIHQDQLIEKYSKPEIQVVQSPWEAALQTGSASTAFLDGPKYQRSYTPSASVASPSPVNFNQDVRDFNLSGSELPSRLPTHCTSSNSNQDSYKAAYNTPIQPCNPQRELAYKPTVAQGWGGRNVELPKGLYVPKEISLSSYAPPPTQSRDYPGSAKVDFSRGHHNSLTGDVRPEFPISNATASGLYSSVPPKQQHHVPVSYDKVQSVPQVNFNPSPLSFDKLSKFQETGNSIQNQRYLNVNKPHPNSSVQNASPTPFGSGRTDNRTNFNNISQQLSHSSTPPTKHIPQQQFGGYEQKTQQMRSSPGQCFNNSARGWRTTSNTTTQRNVFYSKIPVVATESLPYSDF